MTVHVSQLYVFEDFERLLPPADESEVIELERSVKTAGFNGDQIRYWANPPDGKPTPPRVMALTDDQIRGVGFSRPKVSYIKDLASHVLDGRLDLKALKKYPEDEVMRRLVAVKGIGRWTAEIHLMFRLGRPDILPSDDLGLLNAVHRAYGKRKRPTPDQLRKMGEAWRPYRSVASWYLWASLE